MKPTIKHRGRILMDGTKKYYNQPLYDEQIKQLLGKEFEEIIKEKHKRPSVDQHGYYRGGILLTCLADEKFSHFDNADSIHEDVFAPMFLSYTQQIIVGNESWIKPKVRSTADLSEKEMSEFIEKVLAWCSNEGIKILGPEDYYSRYYKTINHNELKERD